MSAPDHAIPLGEENPDWKDGPQWRFICCNEACGYEGHRSELLCVPEDDTLWCPVCRSLDWVWK